MSNSVSAVPVKVVESRPAPGRTRAFLLLMMVLGGLMALGSLSTDMYLPAFPDLARSLHVGVAAVQLTLTTFLAGFCIGQLIWGPLGDRFGRRGMSAIGLTIFAVGSIGCSLAHSVEQLIFWRAFQAFGAAAGPVLARAMVRDLYAKDQAARMLSVLILAMGIAPLLGPILGGQVLLYWNWRGIFWVQAALGLAGVAMLLTMQETLKPENRASLRLVDMLVSYVQLGRNKRLVGYGLASGAFYGAGYAYLAGSPYAYIELYHVKPQLYGALFGLNICGLMAMNAVNSRFVTRIGSDRMLRLGVIVLFLSGAALAFDGRTGFGGLWGLVVPSFFIISMNGAVVANAVAGALAAFPRKAGAASAVVGAIQFGAGILATAMTGWFADGTAFTYGWIACLATLVGLIACFRWVRGPAEA